MIAPELASARVIAPPPLIFLAMLAAGILLDRYVVHGSTTIGLTERFAATGFLVAGGVAVIIAALGRFRAAATPPEPWRSATAVVTTGIYRFTRNPMYLGMAAIYLGLALAADSPVALALFVPLLAIVHYGVIAREERYMARIFGPDYDDYKARVRRWF